MQRICLKSMFLLDTNVVSELRKVRAGKANRRVAKWADSVEASELFVSVITIQELEIGVRLIERRDAEQGRILRVWLNEYVMTAFKDRVLPVDIEIAVKSAELHIPNPKPQRDSLIAATALVHGLTVVTRNVHDFKFPTLRLLNPWEG